MLNLVRSLAGPGISDHAVQRSDMDMGAGGVLGVAVPVLAGVRRSLSNVVVGQIELKSNRFLAVTPPFSEPDQNPEEDGYWMSLHPTPIVYWGCLFQQGKPYEIQFTKEYFSGMKVTNKAS